jgi:ABC-2 type transport system ATP-binding protein
MHLEWCGALEAKDCWQRNKLRGLHVFHQGAQSRTQHRPEDHLQLVMEQVGKLYSKKVWGLLDFSLTLQPGVLGLLGPNGAGKSTLMRILATVTKPTQGKVTWNAVDIVQSPDNVRSVLGYLPQDFGVYPNLTPPEFLEYLAAVKGLDRRHALRRIEELLVLVNLSDVRKRPLGGFSGGMKQRIGIAQALLNDPQLLIVDEPTAGLDPEERVRFRNLLSDLSGERIVILSSHIVSDIEATASDIAIVSAGRLLAHAAPEDLLRAVEGQVWEFVVTQTELTAMQQRYQVISSVRRSDGIHLRIFAPIAPNANADSVSPTLEDAYLACLSAHRAVAA